MSLETNAVEVEDEEFVDELKPGTKLMLGQYTIEGFLAAGGFGITYTARDSLDRRVVIKECFPGSFCRRQNHSVTPRSRAHQNELKSIVRLFSQEAMSLAKANHPNIVGVHQVFEENNTAYMALDYVHGRDLLEILQEDPDSLTPDLVESYLTKILDAIKHIHQMGILHRDISPDNIIINDKGEPILIDFGAARESSNERVTRMLSALRVVKDGYSPQEFYIAGSDQSPSCDLYSLAASFYHLITRELPPDSQWRLSSCAAGDQDPYVSLGEKTKDYSETFVSALDKAMSILPRDRMQSAEEWLEHMASGPSTEAAPATKTTPENAKAETGTKSFMPVLLGSTAIAAAAGAGFFMMSSPGSEAPTSPSQTEQAAVLPVPSSEAPASSGSQEPSVELADAPFVVPSTDSSPTFGDEPEVAVAPAADAESPAAEQVPDLPQVADVATEVAEPPVPAVEETTDFVVPPIVLALPSDVVAPQARPFREADAAVAAFEDSIPAVDTEAPTAPLIIVEEAPTEQVATTEDDAPIILADETAPSAPAIVETEAAQPVQQPASAIASEASLDFFRSMASSSEPEIVSAARTSRTPSVEVNATPEPAPVAATPEVPRKEADTGIVTRFVPVMPFTLSPWQPGVVISVTDNAPAWLGANSRIVSVNGQPVTTNDEITAMLQDAAPKGNATGYDVTIGVDSGLNTAVTERTLTIGKEQHTLLVNGLSFVSRESGGSWITEVASVPSGTTNFRVGDTLVSYVSTWEDLNGPDTLKAILDREMANGTSSFSFAVSRDGEIWIEAFNLAALN
ncbi:MAG: protein kinase [Pseudomonadota bacterium]